jgi:hypothetical protein
MAAGWRRWFLRKLWKILREIDSFNYVLDSHIYRQISVWWILLGEELPGFRSLQMEL